MHSTEVQAKPLFSWKALGWALLYFWFFSTLLQAIIYISGYSGTNGIRDLLLFSLLWLILVFLFLKWIKIIAAVIGVVLWVASLVVLCYYVIYGQEFLQSVLFVMFETNTNEASEYLSQYFSLKIVLIVLAYMVVAVLLWTCLCLVYIPKLWCYVVSFALLYGLILHLIAMNMFIKNKLFEKMLDNLALCMEPAALWQFLTGYYQYCQQLNLLTKLLNENNALLLLANFKDELGNELCTLVLVIGESTQCGCMSLYGYLCETMLELDVLHKTDLNLTVFNNVVMSCLYTIEILQQALTFANEKNLDLYLMQLLLMNMMKQVGYKTFWITNQQMMTACNTMLMVFSCQTDKQYYMNQQCMQSACEYDTNVLKLFQDVLNDPALKKLIIVHLLGMYIKYKYCYLENQGKFDGNTDYVLPGLSAEELESYNDYDNANLYNDHVVASLIKDFKVADLNGFLVYFSDHGEEVYDMLPHKTQGCNEDNLMCYMYTILFLLWMLEKWQVTHPCDFSQDVDCKYSLVELIHTWSDLVGLSYDGYDPTCSVVNLQFKETTCWIGNLYKKNVLIDYDTLLYGDQVGNQ